MTREQLIWPGGGSSKRVTSRPERVREKKGKVQRDRYDNLLNRLFCWHTLCPVWCPVFRRLVSWLMSINTPSLMIRPCMFFWIRCWAEERGRDAVKSS